MTVKNNDLWYITFIWRYHIFPKPTSSFLTQENEQYDGKHESRSRSRKSSRA